MGRSRALRLVRRCSSMFVSLPVFALLVASEQVAVAIRLMAGCLSARLHALVLTPDIKTTAGAA